MVHGSQQRRVRIIRLETEAGRALNGRYADVIGVAANGRVLVQVRLFILECCSSGDPAQ